MIVNVFWPFVPAALAIRYARPDLNRVIFMLSYIDMVPSPISLDLPVRSSAESFPKRRTQADYCPQLIVDIPAALQVLGFNTSVSHRQRR